jgi:Pyridoxamine 5'-phosphate oxidase
MSGLISEATAAFLGEVLPVIVGTRRRSGAVKMNPAWYEFRDGTFWLNSWRGAHWLDHVERERRASLLFIDPRDMYRVVHVEARLVRTATEGAGEHIDRLSQRYRGGPYRTAAPQQRVIVELEPVRVRSSLDVRARPAPASRRG